MSSITFGAKATEGSVKFCTQKAHQWLRTMLGPFEGLYTSVQQS